MLTTFIPPAYLPCTKAMNELQKTKVKELQLETHHRCKYLLVKCRTPPYRMTAKSAIMALVEDEDEECVMLQLHGQQDENLRPTIEILNEGMVIVVKEPFFKVVGDTDYRLRIDHVSNIFCLTLADQRVPIQWRPRFLQLDKSVLEWKGEGDQAIYEKKYWDAIGW